MTSLTKAIRRKVMGLLNRPLIVTLYPGGVIGFKEGRVRTEYTLPLVTCYKYAVLATKIKSKKEIKRGKK